MNSLTSEYDNTLTSKSCTFLQWETGVQLQGSTEKRETTVDVSYRDDWEDEELRA